MVNISLNWIPRISRKIFLAGASPVHLTAAIVKILSFIWALGLHLFCMKNGMVTSGVLVIDLVKNLTILTIKISRYFIVIYFRLAFGAFPQFVEYSHSDRFL